MTCGWTKTTCPYCGVGCGVLARPEAGGEVAEIKGDPDHPANFGRLCSKGTALGETLSLDDRLLHPVVDGARASWGAALDRVATAFADTIAEHGPDSVALYVSGQILTEDYYVANKLAKGFIGTANIDTNSRLCMASSVAGHRRAFGTDTVPGVYEDLELADVVVLVGSNLAWCHPVLYQRLAAAKETRGTKVVVIDPRETATCAIADLHLALKPGTDVALFNGLFTHLSEAGRFDHDYIARHTTGMDGALGAARHLSLSEIAELTELPASAIARFYELFARHDRAVTVYSQGVNQSSAGTDKVNAILNCHLATGRIGKPGTGPFSVTGQPNAMGGREVGGLANMLAAHMDIENPAHRALVQEFWQSPRMPERAGLKAVDLFRAVGDGRIKALWIMATNPVDSLPEADSVRAALDACPFVVVSDVTAATDTAAFADVLLPATAWGEKDGTVTNSERRISRQRAFLPPPGEGKPDWWHLAEVAKRLGHGAMFDYSGPTDIFAEYAALTGYCNDGSRDLDLSAFAAIAPSTYDDLSPVQWPVRRGEALSTTRFFADGGFYTPDRRARFVATPYRPPASAINPAYPLVLNTGRIRDQWHTMTRTAKTARLLAHIAEPFVEIHPADARMLGLAPADLATVESASGQVIARVAVTERQRQGSVFVPMHWTAQFASDGRIGTAVAANTDPVSGQPEAKHTPVRVARYEAAWHAFAVTTVRPDIAAFDYGAFARADGGYRVEAAGTKTPRDWSAMAAAVFGVGAKEADILSYQDRALGHYRFAAFKDGRCIGMLYAGRAPVELSRSWAVDQLAREIAPHQRLGLLAGRSGCDVPDRGAIVCACFGVGQNEIVNVIVNGECRSVAEVGACLKAGTNCGSCRAEIGRLLNDARLEKAV